MSTDLPARMREAVDGLGDAQLDTPYRPSGLTVRQALAAPRRAHHLAAAARTLVG